MSPDNYGVVKEVTVASLPFCGYLECVARVRGLSHYTLTASTAVAVVGIAVPAAKVFIYSDKFTVVIDVEDFRWIRHYQFLR